MLSSLHAQPLGLGGALLASAYAGGYPGFQPFPPFYVPPSFPPMPLYSTGGYGAGASATIGDGQAHQTAYLSPENPVSIQELSVTYTKQNIQFSNNFSIWPKMDLIFYNYLK